MADLYEQGVKLNHYLTETIFYYRQQNYYLASHMSQVVINLTEQFAEMLSGIGFVKATEELLHILEPLMGCMNRQDEVGIADRYEHDLLPFLYELQAVLIENDFANVKNCWRENAAVLQEKDKGLYEIIAADRENIPDEYMMDFARSGDPVLSILGSDDQRTCLNSTVNPWQEALLYSSNQKSDKAVEYILIGFGMGYHAQMLLRRPECRKLTILEGDIYQLQALLSYRNISGFLRQDKVILKYCPDSEDYVSYLKGSQSDQKICIWYPSMKMMKNQALREKLENYWVADSSVRNIGFQLEENFVANQKLGDQEVSCLRSIFHEKTMILIAGGPSLDEEMDMLRHIQREDVLLVCVGKVARKLLSEQICPDFIVMIDGLPGTHWQINGIEDCGIPLIYLSTVASAVAKGYQGKRYIAYQHDFPMAEEYARQHRCVLYNTGGSVSTFVLDFGLEMGCKKIICIGLDLGYPGDKTHAQGVGNAVADRGALRQVESVNGGMVATSKTLDIYRQWIERRIRGVKQTELINASSGARIHGMSERKLESCFPDIKLSVPLVPKEQEKPEHTICCYAEDLDGSIGVYLALHDKDSMIHLYQDVIESCEGKMFYAVGEILNLYMQEEFCDIFVTDVPDLYAYVKKLLHPMFKRVLYIEGGHMKRFLTECSVEEMLQFEVKVLPDAKLQKILNLLMKLKQEEDILTYMQYLELLRQYMDIASPKMRVICRQFCVCLYELCCGEWKYQCSLEYHMMITSIMMKLEDNVDYTNKYLSNMLSNPRFNEENLFFVWNQFKNISLRKTAHMNNSSHVMLDEIYERTYDIYSKRYKNILKPISRKERDPNCIMILAIQILGNHHAPTRTVVERCKTLLKMGKKIVLVNTTEQYTGMGCIPMYAPLIGNTEKEYQNVSFLKMDNFQCPFLQLDPRMPMNQKIEALYNLICGAKPYYILSIGTGSILADLMGHVVPCASMALAFSTVPHTMNRMKILGRHMDMIEKKEHRGEDIIESRFTFELSPQKETFTRAQYHLAEDRFILVVVGIRLDYELDSDFLEMLNRVCMRGCDVVFAGTFDTYEKLVKPYMALKQHSRYIGYCQDMLALMDICDLYVNPRRLGGGFSVIEAFCKGVPGVYLPVGDVSVSGGPDFIVRDYGQMEQQIRRYRSDQLYYNQMADKARKRAKLMTDSESAMRELDEAIVRRVQTKYW